MVGRGLVSMDPWQSRRHWFCSSTDRRALLQNGCGCDDNGFADDDDQEC
jgi:hypothetical protein